MNITGYDFSGWATRPNLLCSDGRVILKDAFKDCDGKKVPLVYNHVHDNSAEVLGHAILESRDGGIYAYGFFNNTEGGRNGKEMVRHGDVSSLSIFANQLREQGKNVLHGMIREVSLVLAGANPGATIDVVLEHSDDFDGEAIIDVGFDNAEVLFHSEDKAEEAEDAKEEPEAEKEDDKDESKEDDSKEEETKEKPIREVFETLTDEQKAAVAMVVGQIISDTNKADDDKDEDDGADDKDDSDDNEIKHSDIYDEGDYDDMKYNIFEGQEMENGAVLSHADQQDIIQKAIDGKASLKQVIMSEMQGDTALAHAITDHNGNSVDYGIANIDYMFPDARVLGNQPELISKNQDWVDKVINGTHHTPFSRVKSLFADITGEDARARGYVKGNQKVSEVIEALQRETTPQTIYKLQKLDRDDIIDITDFDVVAWIKAEMQIMLKAEIARAILIGDGRAAGNDKIKETNVHPIYNDLDTYTVKVPVSVEKGAKDSVKANAIIDAIILSRRLYKGSGNPSFFVDETWLGQLLLLKDGMGRRLYETEASLAAALRVKEIIPVDVMDGQKIKINDADKPLVGIIVNLQDYNVGADKGGATSFFDDFDINFNRYEYLYETRMSGALVKPYSAMSVYIDEAA